MALEQVQSLPWPSGPCLPLQPGSSIPHFVFSTSAVPLLSTLGTHQALSCLRGCAFWNVLSNLLPNPTPQPDSLSSYMQVTGGFKHLSLVRGFS